MRDRQAGARRRGEWPDMDHYAQANGPAIDHILGGRLDGGLITATAWVTVSA